MFGKFEDNKGNLRIQEYGVSETTLEQIFVSGAPLCPVLETASPFAFGPMVVSGIGSVLDGSQNQFAAQQEEETGPVRGMVSGGAE